MVSSYRFSHILGVERLVVALAKRHGADPAKAALAALLHDAAKGMTRSEQLRILRRGRERPDRLSRAKPGLLHAYAGAAIARCSFGVRDAAVLSAVRLHTTGRPGMGKLERILFVADYAEPGRGLARGAKIRKAAYRDLDLAVVLVYAEKIAHVVGKNDILHPAAVEGYNDAVRRLSR
jgi:predicted HD superfamily hydrolase involved in NAD metabolism